MEIFFYLILPLLLTLVIEIPIYFLFNKQSIKYLLVVYLMNIVLNVLMNCYLLFVFGATSLYFDALIIMELIVFAIEAFAIYWFRNIRFKALLIAYVANSASLLIGLLCNRFNVLASFPIIMMILLLTIFVTEFVLIFIYLKKNTKQ